MKINANVSVEYSVGGQDNSDIDMLITPVDCGKDSCGSYTLQLAARYAWLKVGNLTSPTAKSLSFVPAGMPAFNITATGGSVGGITTSLIEHNMVDGSPGLALTVNLGKGPVGFSTSSAATVTSIKAKLATVRLRLQCMCLCLCLRA